jgi:hypothetical protein
MSKLIQLVESSNEFSIKTDSISTESTDNQDIVKSFWHLRTYRNPDFEDGLKIVPLRSCLLHNNVDAKNWVIKTLPKWNVDLLESHLDRDTGEIVSQGVYTTNDLKSGNYRKIRAVNRFCDAYQELYKRRKVSIFFYTLTIANQAKTNIRTLFDSFKARLKRNGIKLNGYVWVLEISEDLHVHYHALVCVDRINLKGKSIPEFLKINDLWGARTQIEFARKHVRSYLSKYFVKKSSRILGKRTYGISIKK